LSISESCTVNEADPLGWMTPPLTYELLTVSPDAVLLTNSGEQLTTFESMVTLAAVMVHEPL
jgi:hypothetical protein